MPNIKDRAGISLIFFSDKAFIISWHIIKRVTKPFTSYPILELNAKPINHSFLHQCYLYLKLMLVKVALPITYSYTYSYEVIVSIKFMIPRLIEA